MKPQINNFFKDSSSDGNQKVKEVFYKYLLHLPIIITCVALAVFIGYAYIQYQSPIYASNISVIMPNDPKNTGNSTGNDDFLQDVMLYKKGVNLSTETEVFKTKSLMERVVKQLGTNVLYYQVGKFRNTELYKSTPIKVTFLSVTDSNHTFKMEVQQESGKLYAKIKNQKLELSPNAVIRTGKVICRINYNPAQIIDGNKYLVQWEPTMNVAGEMVDALSVFQPNTTSNILQINLVTENGEKGADILTELINQYNILNIEKKDRIVTASTKFIDERIALLSRELGKVEGGIENYRRANEVVAPDAQNSEGLAEATKAKKGAEDAEVKMNVIGMINQFVSSPANKYQLFPSSLGIDDPTLSSLREQYNELQLKREEQLKTMPAANPSVRTTESQLDKIRGSIVNNLAGVSQSAVQEKSRYESNYQSQRSRLLATPKFERELTEIGRQQNIKASLFIYLLQKREESAITRATSMGEASTPLDPASSSGKPVSPNTTSIYRLAFIIGLVLPLAFISIKEILNDKIITKSDITGVTSVPIIGQIAHNDTKTKKLVVGANERSALAEQFRMVRSNLPLITKGHENNVILVTSYVAGEGKSFCSINLGAVYAIAGKKTVILEFDLRKPTISKALALPDKLKGFVHYMAGEVQPASLPVSVPGYDDLFVIKAGIIPPNPSEMLMDSKLDDLFDYLKKNFDCIIIDTAPVGLVSDSKSLAKFANATIYVVRQRYSSRKQLREVDEIYQAGTFPNLSILVNDVKVSGTNSYYGYNYSSNYNSYYHTEKTSPWKKLKQGLSKETH